MTRLINVKVTLDNSLVGDRPLHNLQGRLQRELEKELALEGKLELSLGTVRSGRACEVAVIHDCDVFFNVGPDWYTDEEVKVRDIVSRAIDAGWGSPSTGRSEK